MSRITRWITDKILGAGDAQLDASLEAARRERDEVAALRPETERIGQQARAHLQQNHFAERIVLGILSTERGKHA